MAPGTALRSIQKWRQLLLFCCQIHLTSCSTPHVPKIPRTTCCDLISQILVQLSMFEHVRTGKVIEGLEAQTGIFNQDWSLDLGLLAIALRRLASRLPTAFAARLALSRVMFSRVPCNSGRSSGVLEISTTWPRMDCTSRSLFLLPLMKCSFLGAIVLSRFGPMTRHSDFATDTALRPARRSCVCNRSNHQMRFRNRDRLAGKCSEGFE